MLAELLVMLGIEAADKGLNALSQKTAPDKWGVYRDGNGADRLFPSMKRVYYTFTPEGEYVLKYINGGIAVNVGLEMAKEREQEAKAKGNKFYVRAPKGGSYTHKMGNDDIDGPRYCRVDGPSNIYYVRRRIVYVDPKDSKYYSDRFYMDMNYKFADFDDDVNDDYKRWSHTPKEIRQIMKDLYTKEISNPTIIDWRKSLRRELSEFHCGKEHRW